MKFGHLEGGPITLGDLRSPWLLTTYKSWDDPPGKGWPLARCWDPTGGERKDGGGTFKSQENSAQREARLSRNGAIVIDYRSWVA